MHLILFFLLFYNSSPVKANDYVVNVDQAKTKKMTMALVPFKYSQNFRTGIEVGNRLYNYIFYNLNSTFYFKFLGPNAYLEDIRYSSLRPSTVEADGFVFNDWKAIGTDILIKSTYSIKSRNILFEVLVYNVNTNKLLLEKIYTEKLSNLPYLANKFSNELMLVLTGKKGIFDSKVVVSRNVKNSRQKEIFVMDWNGSNITQISKNRSTSFSPTFSPDGKRVSYTSFILHRNQKIRNADLLIYSFDTGRTKILSARKGSNSGSEFSKDGRFIFFTISSFGHSNIYRINSFDGKNLKRITNGPRGAMNIEVDISPDGRKLAFSSDRSGRPMIYTSDLDGKNLKRLTYAGRYNSTPTWSPDGKKIAFASNINGKYDIFVIDSNGNNLKRLTSSGRLSGRRSNNEEPTFSPDGRSIMFVSNRTGIRQLYLTDLDGDNLLRITRDKFNYYKPKWGWH